MRVRLPTDLAGGLLLAVATILAIGGRDSVAVLVAAVVAGGSLALLPARLWRVASVVPAGAAWLSHDGPWRAGSLLVYLEAASIAGVGAVVLVLLARYGRRWSFALVPVVLMLPQALGPGGPPAQLHAGPSLSNPAAVDTKAALDYFRTEVSRARVPGAALVVLQGDEIIGTAAVGAASPGVPMTLQSPVVIGSTTKSITALAVYQLVEAHKVDLDSPITRYLAWFSPRDSRAKAITIRQLLTDTSGVPTWAGWKALSGHGTSSPDQLRGLINGIRLSVRPGTKFQYSNANYIILGQIIEAVSTQPYAEYVSTHIFEPLGMTGARAGPNPAAAAGSRFWFGLPVRSTLPFLEVGVPAGYVTADAADLARYLAAQLNGGALGPARVASSAGMMELHRPAAAASGFGVAPGSHYYAMGWYVGTVAGHPAVFHSGDTFDSSSALVMLPGVDLGLAVIANTESVLVPVASTLAEGVTARLVGRPAPSLSSKMLSSYAGVGLALGVLLGFTVSRSRRSLRGGRRGWVLPLTRDLALPAAIVLVPPELFSQYLDRAETLNALDFWRLAERGLPDVTIVVLGCLAVRALAGISDLYRALRSLRQDAATELPRGLTATADADSP